MQNRYLINPGSTTSQPKTYFEHILFFCKAIEDVEVQPLEVLNENIPVFEVISGELAKHSAAIYSNRLPTKNPTKPAMFPFNDIEITI